MTSSFAERDAVERLGATPRGEPIELDNPVNKEMPLLRTTMIPSILDVVRRNANVGESDLRVFEVGKIFLGPASAHSERWMLAGALAGAAERPAWDRDAKDVDFFDGKGVLWALAEALEVDSPGVSCYDGPLFEEGHAAGLLLGDRAAGSFGMLSREVAERWDLPQQVFVFELELDVLTELCAVTGTFDALPKYPKSRRDLALVVDEGTAVGAIADAIGELGELLLDDVDVFDMYRGEQLPAGKKSLGFSLTYMSRERTLTDGEVDEAHGRIVTHLVERFGASLRE